MKLTCFVRVDEEEVDFAVNSGFGEGFDLFWLGIVVDLVRNLFTFGVVDENTWSY